MCDDDKFGSFEVYVLCVMMISLEVWKFGSPPLGVEVPQVE